MKDNQTLISARKGMNRDAHPSLLDTDSYTFALNATYEDVGGEDGFPMLQNEQSNVKCLDFSGTKKVVGYKNDLTGDRIILFLTDIETGISEIGEIANTKIYTKDTDVLVKVCGCDEEIVLNTPLEEITQQAGCNYKRIISDGCCTECLGNCTENGDFKGCLNFSLEYPIREGNIQLKDEKCGKTLYWTDGNNPPRYLMLDQLGEYRNVVDRMCENEAIPTYTCDDEPADEVNCVNCDALRIFPLYTKPCLQPVDVQYGGRLQPGTYEFLVAYSDKIGNETTQYFSITNPITIVDESRFNVDDINIYARTNLGIRLEIGNLDKRFNNYKVVVIQTLANGGATSYFVDGVYPISNTTVEFYSEENKTRTTMLGILAVKQTYTKTEIMTSNNGYIFHGGLTVEKEMNLQPVVNLMGAFLRWTTVRATESIYNKLVNTSLYRGYMRDETYPFSIKFIAEDGFETANFPLVNRPSTIQEEQDVVSDSSPNKIQEASDMWKSLQSDSCDGSDRKRRWEYYNTAEELSYQGNISLVDNCDLGIYKMGKFGIYESKLEYPDNPDLYNSQKLNIPVSLFPTTEFSYKNEFEKYFGSSTKVVDGVQVYDLPDSTNFICKGIRHYKFPDNTISPFMEAESVTSNYDSTSEAIVYPIGVWLDPRIINFFLDMAEYNGLISKEQRGRLTQYEIYRGDRVVNKSVIAKGLGFNMFNYKDDPKDVSYGGSTDKGNTPIYYPNYPYNSLEDDKLHFIDKDHKNFVPAPKTTESDLFTFHSPDTHFEKPILPSEIKLEGYMTGLSTGIFSEVKDHSKWVILAPKAYTLALSLATTEATFEVIAKLADLYPGKQNSISQRLAYRLIYWVVVIGSSLHEAGVKINKYMGEWLEVFKNKGQPQNFAFYYTSVGHYNNLDSSVRANHHIRAIDTGKYLNDGRYIIPSKDKQTGQIANLKVNNFKRESSVFLKLNDSLEYETKYNGRGNAAYEKSRFTHGEKDKSPAQIDVPAEILVDKEFSKNFKLEKTMGYTYRAITPDYYSNLMSPYITLKQYLPTQYGNINSVKWLSTGYCGDLKSNEFRPIFGGDIFITRFTLKRKLPLFLRDAVKISDRTPFNYYIYRNIGYPRYFVDYDVTDTMRPKANFGSWIRRLLSFGAPDSVVTQVSFYKFDTPFKRGNYTLPPSKFYLYYYGIPNFLVESERNLNTRQGGKNPEDGFYPNIGDYIDWTQESNVPIHIDNKYIYNSVYSKTTTATTVRTLPSTFNQELFDCLYDSPNGVAYSMQDMSEQDLTDPWLIYKPMDYYQFQTAYGKLIDLRSIESTQILGRFENQTILFNAIDVLADRITPETQVMGTGGIFQSRPIEFTKSDLGYAGTQHKTMVSCEFGHFWVDAKRGHVFQVNTNGQGLREVTTGMKDWFKENLPFKLLNGGIKNLTTLDLDNQFKSLGIVMGYDSRLKRIFLTKKDYNVRKEYRNLLNYKEGKIYLDNLEVQLTDDKVFEDVSFTLSYSPITQSWISYHSFKPDYFIGHHNFFQTGLNFSRDKSEEGLWNHLVHNNSFQVYYGKKYPFIIETVLQNKFTNKLLSSVNYWADSKRFHNNFDYAENRRIGFNKAWIYNHTHNSGQLNLITAQNNNLHQKLQYPKVASTISTDILATEKDKYWSFNSFYNRVRNELNNQPIWKNDKNQIHKELNPKSLQFNQRWSDRLRGDWFLIRLQQDQESRYKFIFKWITSKEKLY